MSKSAQKYKDNMFKAQFGKYICKKKSYSVFVTHLTCELINFMDWRDVKITNTGSILKRNSG